MPIIRLTSTDVPELDVYCRLTETQLRNRLHSESGVFIAESPKVIRTALGAGYEPLSLLCEERHLTGDAADIVERLGERPIFTGSRELLAELTGYTLTRGVLCAMRRPTALPAEEVCRNARRVAVIDSVTDTTNIGAIFRSAAALGMNSLGASESTAYHYAFGVACLSLIVSIAIYYGFRWTFAKVDNTAKKKEAVEEKVVETKHEETPEDKADTHSRLVALFLVFAVVIFFWRAFHCDERYAHETFFRPVFAAAGRQGRHVGRLQD